MKAYHSPRAQVETEVWECWVGAHAECRMVVGAREVVPQMQQLRLVVQIQHYLNLRYSDR